jgi:uncharacterized membrane-anchored protein
MELGIYAIVRGILIALQTRMLMEAMRRFLRRISAEVDSADRVPAVTAATVISQVTAMWMELTPLCSNRTSAAVQ